MTDILVIVMWPFPAHKIRHSLPAFGGKAPMQAPDVQMSFGNGRLEEFLLDQSITAQQMQTSSIAICVAAAMAMFNFTQLTRLPSSRKNKPICWDRLRSWAKAVQQQYSEEELAAEKMGDMEQQVISFTCSWFSYKQQVVHVAGSVVSSLKEDVACLPCYLCKAHPI